MRQLTALLAILWAAGNLLVAYLFVTSGLLEKTIKKGLPYQSSLVLGGILIALFALILVGQSLGLAVSRDKATARTAGPAAS